VIPHCRFDCERIEPSSQCFVLPQPRARSDQIEEFYNLSSDGTRELAHMTQCVLRGRPSLLVRGRAEWQVGVSIEEPVPCLHAISGRIYIGEIGLHVPVDLKCALSSSCDAGGNPQLAIRPDPDSNKNGIGRGREIQCARNGQLLT